MTSRSNPRPARGRRRPSVPDADKRALAYKQTRLEHSQEIAEDYVEAIAKLIAAAGEARAVDLARHLGVSHVTVIRTVARLQRDGFVSTRPYRAIFLTERGARVAEDSARRHELVEQFLVDLGIPADVARKDAEGIEHHCSPQTLAAFRRHLGRPPSDPTS